MVLLNVALNLSSPGFVNAGSELRAGQLLPPLVFPPAERCWSCFLCLDPLSPSCSPSSNCLTHHLGNLGPSRHAQTSVLISGRFPGRASHAPLPADVSLPAEQLVQLQYRSLGKPCPDHVLSVALCVHCAPDTPGASPETVQGIRQLSTGRRENLCSLTLTSDPEQSPYKL